MEKEANILKIGDYESKPDGTRVHKKPIFSKDKQEVVCEEEVPFANHTAIVKSIRVIDNGVEKTEEILVEILRAGRMWGEIPGFQQLA